jgi:hypothetical protein
MTMTLGITNNNSAISQLVMLSGGPIFHQAKGEKPCHALTPKVMFEERFSRLR